MARRLLPLSLLPLGACQGIQSALDPTGRGADAIATVSWAMFAGAAAILLLVVAFTAWAAWGPAARRGWLAGSGAIVGGGIVFPVVTLSVLLVWGLWTTRELADAGPAPLRIEVVGEQWWWRVHYLDEAGRPALVTANEIRIPVGQPVDIIVRTADVIHSFWVPNLAGKLDMIPGHVNRLRIEATEAGTIRGQCAEYCGGAHALMAFFVVALPPDAFAAWLAAQAEPAAEPAEPFLRQGRELFLASGCGACHTVRGTPAAGVLGPDLTHVGSRLSLAAGILPNNQGTLAGWIADAQHIKPGNRMPSFNVVSGPELRAIAAYLESLR